MKIFLGIDTPGLAAGSIGSVIHAFHDDLPRNPAILLLLRQTAEPIRGPASRRHAAGTA